MLESQDKFTNNTTEHTLKANKTDLTDRIRALIMRNVDNS